MRVGLAINSSSTPAQESIAKSVVERVDDQFPIPDDIPDDCLEYIMKRTDVYDSDAPPRFLN